MIRRMLCSLAVLSVVAPPTAAALAACYTPPEATAVHVRMLQSELMVAALACRESNPELGMIGQYNAFVNRHTAGLVGNTRVLEGHFRQHYGGQHRRHMETFITALANEASKRSMTADFCRGAASLFGEVAALEWRDLERLSTDRANGNGAALAACTSDARNGIAKPR